MYIVAMCLLKLAPSVLFGPHFPVGLRLYLQPCRYVWNSDQLLELYTKIMFRGRVPSRARPCLGLFIRFSCALLPCGRLVYPHGLGLTWCSRSNRTDETTFLCDSFVRSDVSQSRTPDLSERLRVNLSSDSLKGPGNIPLTKASTVMASSVGFSLTT